MDAVVSDDGSVTGEFRTSAHLGDLAKALAAAALEFGAIHKDREVFVKSDKGSYKFEYATLAEIIGATRPALNKNGLFVIQMPALMGARQLLITRLIHESGQWIEAGVPINPVAQGPQPFGSALNYMRRYAYTALLNIAADQDDDGNAAQNNQAELRDRGQPRRASPPPAAVQRKIEPPHDPDTGEIAPHAIPVPPTPDGAGTNWIAWGGSLIAAVKAAANREEGEAWVEMNRPALVQCGKSAPKANSSVIRAIDAMRERFTETIDESGRDFVGPEDAGSVMDRADA